MKESFDSEYGEWDGAAFVLTLLVLLTAVGFCVRSKIDRDNARAVIERESLEIESETAKNISAGGGT